MTPNARIPDRLVEEARAAPVRELWTRLGFELGKGNANARSPWREDTHPSIQIGGAKNIVFDHGSGEALDAIALVQKVRGCGFQEAVEFALGRAVQPENGTSARDPVENLARLRGWTRAAMQRLGARADGETVFFPMLDDKRRIVGHKRRRGDAQSFGGGAKSLTAKGGRNGLFIPTPFPPDGPVLVCEGEADALAALSAGHEAVVGTAGASVSQKALGWLQAFLAGREVVLTPDPDKAGREWLDRVGTALANARCRVLFVPAGQGDLDARLRRAPDRAAALRELIAAAVEFAPRIEGASAKNAEPGRLAVRNDSGALIPLNVARVIAAERRIIHTGGGFYVYSDGCYRRAEDWQIERRVVEIVGASIRRGALLDVMKLLHVETAVEDSRLYRVGRIINLKNGLLNLDTGLMPHSPDHLSTVQIPIGFDAEAACPRWEKALSEWFPGEPDVIELLQEWCGLCLVPDARQHKALLLLGEGANGKSVFCEMLRALVGTENTAAISVNALGRSFALAELFGKLINLSLEADVRDGFEEAAFKAIVAGDPISAERKFRDPFVFQPFARFTISTNNLFHINDRTDGVYRRLLIVRFTRNFAEEAQDRDLCVKLQGELPGILNWALRGLARLERRGRFIVPKRVQDEIAEHRRHCNPVSAWVEGFCETADPQAWESAATLYSSYRAWAASSGHRPLAQNKFGVELKRLGATPFQAPTAARTRGFAGIRLNGANAVRTD